MISFRCARRGTGFQTPIFLLKHQKKNRRLIGEKEKCLADFRNIKFLSPYMRESYSPMMQSISEVRTARRATGGQRNLCGQPAF
jgi:hypothetical protein